MKFTRLILDLRLLTNLLRERLNTFSLKASLPVGTQKLIR
jgi:hypothetical protein